MTDINGVPTPNPSDDQNPVPLVSPTPPAPPVPPAPAAYAAPSYAAPTQAGYAPPADPGKTLGIVGFVLAFVVSLAGIIVSAIALSKSRKAGYPNGFALAGLILSIVFFVVGIIIAIFVLIAVFAVIQECATLGNGVHQLSNGSTFTCDF